MPILSINRDNYVGAPGIVRISTSDTIAAVLTTNYLRGQAAIISQLNNGPMDWEIGDLVAVSCSNGSIIATFVGSNFYSLAPLAEGAPRILKESVFNGPGTATVEIPSGTTYLTYLVVGGGGGGGGIGAGSDTAVYAAAGGGGSGARCFGIFGALEGTTAVADIPDSPFTVTIGAGGLGGFPDVAGLPGEVSTLSWPGGGTLDAHGGEGGSGALGVDITGCAIASGGAGGLPDGSFQIGLRGTSGDYGISVLGQVASGQGGFFGDFGSPGNSVVNLTANGNIGNFGGAGGSGAASVVSAIRSGGRGSTGLIILTFYGPSM